MGIILYHEQTRTHSVTKGFQRNPFTGRIHTWLDSIYCTSIRSGAERALDTYALYHGFDRGQP